MRTGRFFTLLNGMALVGMLVQSACSGGGSSTSAATTAPATPVAVAIVGVPADVVTNTTLPVSAQVVGSSNTAVTWTVDGIPNGNADVGTISGTGSAVTYTAPATEGSHDMAVASVVDPTKAGRAHFTVHHPGTISSVVLSPAALISNVNVQNQFTATVSGSGNINSSVTWSAQKGSITGSGLYTAPPTGGGDVVTATSVQDSSKTTTASVTVTVPIVPPTISSVVVSPATISLNVSAQKQFAATVTGTGSYSSAVTWSAQRGSITSGGLYTAPSTGGTDVVTAKSVQDTSRTATASITVGSASVPAGTSVKTYGAKGDGVTDDTAAIQRCINAIAGTGGTVVVPAGTYMINGNYSGSFGLRLGSNMTFAMDASAVLKVIPNSSDIYSILTCGTVSNVTITGGTIQGDRTNGSNSTRLHGSTSGADGHGLVIGNASNIHVSGMTGKECWGDAIYVCNSSSNVTLTNCIADHNYRMGISAVDVDGLYLTNCTGQNTGMDGPCLPGGGSGFDLEANVGEVTTNVVYSYCTATRNAQVGIGLGGRDAYGTTHVIVDHCTCTGNGDSGIGMNDYTRDTSITNNTSTGNGISASNYGASGIYLGGNPYTTNITVTGNTVSNNSQYGIWVESATNAVVTGNTGSGNGSGAGVHNAGGNTGCTFSPNTIF